MPCKDKAAFSNFREERGNEQAEFSLEGGNGPSPTPITLPLRFFLASVATSVEVKRGPRNRYHLTVGHVGAQRELFVRSDVQELRASPSQRRLRGGCPVCSGLLSSCLSFYMHVRAGENAVQNNSNSLGRCKQAINSSGLCAFTVTPHA